MGAGAGAGAEVRGLHSSAGTSWTRKEESGQHVEHIGMTHLAVTLATVCGAPDFEPPHETATPMVSPASEASMGGSTKYARHDVSTCTDTGVRRWLLLVRTVNVHDLHRLPPSTISFVSPTASLVSLAAMDGAGASTMSHHTAHSTRPP